MDYLWLVLLSLFFFDSLRNAFWPGADSSSWEMNWRGLDGLHQAWIAAAGNTKDSRAKLTERGELDLHKGYLRRGRRRDSYLALAITPLLIGMTVLVLAGALPDSYLTLPLLLIGLTPGLVLHLRERRAKARYQSAQERSS